MTDEDAGEALGRNLVIGVSRAVRLSMLRKLPIPQPFAIWPRNLLLVSLGRS